MILGQPIRGFNKQRFVKIVKNSVMAPRGSAQLRGSATGVGSTADIGAGAGPDLWGKVLSATFVGARGAIRARRVYIVKS